MDGRMKTDSQTTEIEKLRATLKKIVDMKEQVTRASIREFAAEELEASYARTKT